MEILKTCCKYAVNRITYNDNGEIETQYFFCSLTNKLCIMIDCELF